MKKFVSKLLVHVISFIFGILLGVISAFYLALWGWFADPITLVEIFVSLILSIFLATAIHEAGHLIFGLISGYGFSSYRVGSLMLIKINGKLKLRTFKLAGTGGQCLMTPPEKKDGKYPYVLYNLGGAIINLVTLVLCVIFLIDLWYLPFISILLMYLALFSLCFAVLNGVPMHIGGLSNDGMNAIYLGKDELAIEAFMNQLRMNAESVSGKSLSQMPDEWFEIPNGADMTNVSISSIAVFRTNRNFEKLDMQVSEEEIESLLKSGCNVVDIHKKLLICDLLVCKLFNDAHSSEIGRLLTNEQKKFMSSMKNFVSIIRTEYVIALLRDADEKKAEKLLAHFNKIAKNHPLEDGLATDKEIMRRAREKYESLKTSQIK